MLHHTPHNGAATLLLEDPGTTAYSLPIHGNYFKRTLAHCTIFVDWQNQLEATGESNSRMKLLF
jgi:hypothetical protein